MESFEKKIEVRWSDLDPNFHVLHSKYYDYGAHCRMLLLAAFGFTIDVMMSEHIGPILFREECVFKRELRLGDDVSIDVVLKSATKDFSRWSMIHKLKKNADTLAAVITVDGAWMDTSRRKLATPPAIVHDIFEAAPKSTDFILI